MMDFEEFNTKSEGLVEKIKEQNPIAILRFGSSTRPEDYIPGVSDLDMVVVSQEPIQETSNEVGFEYFFNHPNQFVMDSVNGNPFVMNAILNGEVVYDPKGFIESFKELSGKGLVISPTKNTLYQIVQGIGNQHDKNYVFGLVETNSQQPQMIDQEIPKEQLQQLYSQLKILR